MTSFWLDSTPKLNINAPKFGAWVGGNHQKWSRAYQNEWALFLHKNPRWEEVRKSACKMGENFGFKVLGGFMMEPGNHRRHRQHRLEHV